MIGIFLQCLLQLVSLRIRKPDVAVLCFLYQRQGMAHQLQTVCAISAVAAYQQVHAKLQLFPKGELAIEAV